ncbi:MAG: hypothetical protein ACYCUM_14680 [Solirubrobacteraceae bacterium]
MTKRKSMSDEQLYALIRESRPPAESLPPAAAERVLSEIIASGRNQTEQPRRGARAKPRRKIIRTGTLSVGAVLVLSGSALAAGSALGVIELGGGDTAETLATVPITYQSSNGKDYQVNVPSGAAYTYRLAGGKSNLHCADPETIVESDRQLSSEELHKLLLEESAGPTHVRSDTLPEGVKGISESCIPVHPPTGAEGEAAANAQAEAEAEGLTAEKYREHMRERATGGNAILELERLNNNHELGLNKNHELTQAEAAEVEEAVAAREAANKHQLTQAQAAEVVEEAVATREAAAAGRNEPGR